MHASERVLLEQLVRLSAAIDVLRAMPASEVLGQDEIDRLIGELAEQEELLRASILVEPDPEEQDELAV